MSGVVQKQVLFNRILQGVEYRLSDDDVKQGFATTAVLPAGKLTTTWGDVTRLGMLLPITNDTDKIRIQKLGRNNKNRQEENRSIP